MSTLPGQASPPGEAALRDARPACFWLDRPDAPEPAPPLDEDTTADLAVVGAGFTGLWTALLAKERDPSADVVLLEGRTAGWAASGRNGGFCSASLTHGLANGLERFGPEMPVLDRLGRENLDEIAATVARHGIDCDFERTGELAVATRPWQLPGLWDHAAAAGRLAAASGAPGAPPELLDAEAVRGEIASPAFHGGLWDRGGCAIVDPARLAWGLRRACLDAGVRLYEQTPVGAIAAEGPGLRLSAPHGSVRTPSAALGTGAYAPLLRRLRLYLVPVYDYAMMTEPLSAAQRDSIGWRNRQGVGDLGNQFHYYRLTGDGRILWGGYDAVYYNGGLITAGQRSAPRDVRPAGRALLRDVPAARRAPVHAHLGRRHRHLRPVLRVLRHRPPGPGGLRRRVHGAGRGRLAVRRQRAARPAQRAADRADRAGHGARQAGAVPARAAALRGDPADPGLAGPRRPSRGTPGPVAADPGPARAGL